LEKEIMKSHLRFLRDVKIVLGIVLLVFAGLFAVHLATKKDADEVIETSMTNNSRKESRTRSSRRSSDQTAYYPRNRERVGTTPADPQDGDSQLGVGVRNFQRDLMTEIQSLNPLTEEEQAQQAKAGMERTELLLAIRQIEDPGERALQMQEWQEQNHEIQEKLWENQNDDPRVVRLKKLMELDQVYRQSMVFSRDPESREGMNELTGQIQKLMAEGRDISDDEFDNQWSALKDTQEEVRQQFISRRER